MSAEAARGAPARHAALAGTGAYLTASVLWGLNLPLSAVLIGHFDPYWVSPLRYALAALLLAAMVAASAGAAALRSPIGWGRVLVLSGCVAGFLLLYNVGLYLTHPMTVAGISAGAPLYVALVARVMSGARLPRGFWVATALTLGGAGLSIWGRLRAAGAGSAAFGASGALGHLGEAMVVLAIVSWTVYSILAQRWFTAEVSQLRRTWLSTVGALPWLLAMWGGARLAGLAGPAVWAPSGVALVQLVVAAVFCTALATVAWNIGVGRLGVQVGSLWQNTVPVFAVLISLLAFGVQPLPEQLVGGAIVLAGVGWLQWQRGRG